MGSFSLTGMMGLLVALLLIWTSVGILLAVKRLNDTYELTPNRFIYPASCKPEKCKDPAGFIQFMTPRLYVFAVCALLLSVLLILQNTTSLFSFLPDWLGKRGSVIFFIPLFFWYVVFINKAARRFW